MGSGGTRARSLCEYVHGLMSARGRKDGAMGAEPKVRVAWSPRGNPAQMRLLKCQVLEIFFERRSRRRQTDGVLGEFGAHASRYGKDAIGLMVRRTRAEHVEASERSRAMDAQRNRKDVACAQQYFIGLNGSLCSRMPKEILEFRTIS